MNGLRGHVLHIHMCVYLFIHTHTHTHTHISPTTQWNVIQLWKKERFLLAAAQMDLEGIMLTGICQARKTVSYACQLCVESKKQNK